MFSDSHRAGLLVDCIKADAQGKWFVRVQRRMVGGTARRQATEDVFRSAWEIWQGKGKPQTPYPVAPRITETIDVPRKAAAVATPPTLTHQAADRPLIVPPKPQAGSIDPLAKAIIEKHGIARPAGAKA